MKKISTLLFAILLFLAGNNAFSQTGLIINEFDYDQPSGDTAEFVELYNSTANAIDVANYVLVLVNGNNNTPYDTISFPSQMVNPGAFYVVCGNGGFVPLCDMVLSANINIIQNGAPDAMAIIEVSSGNIIDAVSYEGTVAAPYFETTGIDTAKADPSFTPLIGLSRFPDGSDSDNNDADFNLACITPGTPNVNLDTACVNPVSVPKIEKAKNLLKVFPNPTQGIAIVDYTAMKQKNVTLSLFNVIGKEIKTIQVNTPSSFYQMDLSAFESGVYYVTVKSGTASSTQRVILRK